MSFIGKIGLVCLGFFCAVFNGCTTENKIISYPSNSMEYPQRAITQRSSSYDRDWENGNADARFFDPGQTRVIAELEGPGRITHMWFTIAAFERGYPRSAVIRIYWDGQEKPAVEAPLGDFFAAGHGMSIDINSCRVATSSYGRAYNCYWMMPFRKSARATITNESKEQGFTMYWYVDWEKRTVPEDVPYFHAQYRQEYPVKPGSDYLIADIKGTGHYVGTVLSVRMSQPGWFGEGDDRFYIDGATVPTLHGTGTEDYFNDAWAFRQFNRPNYGVSIWEGWKAGGRITAYRWHVTDPVFFEKLLKVAIEHKGNTFYDDMNLVDFYTDRRPDLYSSVAYWYQQGEAKTFSQMPPVEERMAPYTMIQVDQTLADTLPENVAIDEHNYYSNKKGLLFKAQKEGDAFEIPFEVEKQGLYVVFLRVWPKSDTGIFDFYLDDELVLESEDLFNEHQFNIDLRFGNIYNLSKGTHTIKAINRDSMRGDRCLSVDAIVLEPLDEFEKKQP